MIERIITHPESLQLLRLLMADRALTANELAQLVAMPAQKVDRQLTALHGANIVNVEHSGRHNYYFLSQAEVIRALTAHTGLRFGETGNRLQPGTRNPDLRKARACYRHLAGELGVLACRGLLRRQVLATHGTRLQLGQAGHAWFTAFGIDMTAPAPGTKENACAACLDSTERRHHLGGAPGVAMLTRIIALGWAQHLPGERVVRFSAAGEQAFRACFA